MKKENDSIQHEVISWLEEIEILAEKIKSISPEDINHIQYNSVKALYFSTKITHKINNDVLNTIKVVRDLNNDVKIIHEIANKSSRRNNFLSLFIAGISLILSLLAFKSSIDSQQSDSIFKSRIIQATEKYLTK